MTPNAFLALDVGGANLKAAHSSGLVRSVPFALWREPERLKDRLRALLDDLPAFRRLALTMTAELCDCFATKADGVRHVLDAANRLAPTDAIRVWGTDGRFHDTAEAAARPDLAAASNWLALAAVAARLAPEPGPALLIDVGSTTADLIPLLDGLAVPAGRTDTDRLRSGELVYAGVRRTPVCALATDLPWRGRPIGLAAELFATTLDVYLTRGEIPENAEDRDTADGRPATRAHARDRLARMVGADRESVSPADARSLADAADAALMDRLTESARRATARIGPPRSCLVSGSGEFLAHRVAARLLPERAIRRLSTVWGAAASSAACARALLDLVAEEPA